MICDIWYVWYLWYLVSVSEGVSESDICKTWLLLFIIIIWIIINYYLNYQHDDFNYYYYNLAIWIVSCEVQLESSDIPYIVIPCTFDAQQESKFTMTFSTDAPIALEPLSPDKEWKHVVLEVFLFKLLYYICCSD